MGDFTPDHFYLFLIKQAIANLFDTASYYPQAEKQNYSYCGGCDYPFSMDSGLPILMRL